jgi:hypothetical protein
MNAGKLQAIKGYAEELRGQALLNAEDVTVSRLRLLQAAGVFD